MRQFSVRIFIQSWIKPFHSALDVLFLGIKLIILYNEQENYSRIVFYDKKFSKDGLKVRIIRNTCTVIQGNIEILLKNMDENCRPKKSHKLIRAFP